MTKLTLRNDAVSWAPTDDNAIVVLDLRTSRYLSLNASGAALWGRLAEGATADDLRSELVTTFGLAEAAAERDVAAFVDALRNRDLLDAAP